MKHNFRGILIPLLISLMGLTGNLTAQTRFLTSRNAYLGQTPPTDTPKKFAPGLLAGKGEFSANRTAISNDGTEIYYCTNTTWKNIKDLKVKYFRYDGKKWTGPTILNNELGETSLSPDNNTLYFCSDKAANIVYQSKRTPTGWSAPTEYTERNYVIYDFMPTASGRKYLASNGTWGTPNDINAWRFSVMPAAEQDTTIQSLGYPLNSSGFNGDFFVAMDESYMIISTNETPNFECELYISFHKKDNTWTTPKSLGSLINDGLAHRYGQYVSPDGKYLFYTRATSEADCAIYWVRFDDLLRKLIPADL
ncbi:MAG: PD40 domain-containing protein [Bacteroidetes bacterium]|nr:PD40 domain-containing protein [Bacteroidota bacterium]